MDSELIFKKKLDCAFIVHRELGPGFFENVYEECFNDIHLTQILTYMKLGDCSPGLLLNFNVKH